MSQVHCMYDIIIGSMMLWRGENWARGGKSQGTPPSPVPECKIIFSTMYTLVHLHVCAHTHCRLHFQACSPSPSSKFEFQSLPFIELPDHTSPPLGGIALGGGGCGGAPGNYQPFSASELRLGRLPSLSDCREEALSFSTLPTSQFALKPSTSDMDLHLTEQQHSLFMQRTGFDMTLEPYSWSWVRNARLNPLHLGSFRRTSDHSHGSGGTVSSSNSSGHGGHACLSSSAAPGSYHPVSGIPGGTVSGGGSLLGSSSSQQLPGPSSSSSEPIDISRSSLSVTNSKTIILSNAPLSQHQSTHLPNSTASGTTSTNAATTTAFKSSTPVAPPTATPTSTKSVVGAQPGTTTPQSQSQLPQQQHKVAAQKRAGIGTKKSSPQSTAVRQKQDATSATPQQTQVAVQPSTTKSAKREDREKKGKMAAESKKSVMAAASGQLEGVAPSGATNHASGESESSTVNPRSAESATVSPPTSVATSKDAEPSSKGVSDGATVESMDTSCSSSKSPESNSVPTKAEKPKSLDSKGSSSPSSSTLVQKSESIESSKALSAWMMSKPSVSIQQLSRPRKRENNETDGEDLPKTKNRRTLFASADAALITSQFAQQTAAIKKEEASTAQPLTVTHALNSAMAGLGARNVLSSGTSGLPISSTEISTVTAAAAAAVSQNISKLPLSLATTPNLSVAQNSPMKLHQQHQEAVVNSIQDGVAHLAASIGQDKKTVVSAVSASGQAQTLPGNLSVRRSSTGTNGTNSYQEIFHTERVKQALAG